MGRVDVREKTVKLLDTMARVREDFRRRTGFYPSAFLVPSRAFRIMKRRRFKGADVRDDGRVKAGEFVVMCGRAYETWKFQKLCASSGAKKALRLL